MDAALATGIFFVLLAALAPLFAADTRRSGGWDSRQLWEEVLPRPDRPRRARRSRRRDLRGTIPAWTPPPDGPSRQLPRS